MLDYDKMYEGLIQVTKDTVGTLLSTTPLQTGTTPSVSRERTGSNGGRERWTEFKDLEGSRKAFSEYINANLEW